MLTLRRATVEDAPLLRRWDEEPHVRDAAGDDDWQWETELAEEPPWRDQLIAEVDGVPIGFLQIIDPAEVSRYWGDVPANLRAIDIWIGEAAYLGRGYGTRMMHWAIDFCFADPAVEAILIDPLASNTAAVARLIPAHRAFLLSPVSLLTAGDAPALWFLPWDGAWRSSLSFGLEPLRMRRAPSLYPSLSLQSDGAEPCPPSPQERWARAQQFHGCSPHY